MIGKKRKAALEYFQKNAAGEYIYTGGTYTYRTEKISREKALLILWALGIVSPGGLLAGGCMLVPGLGSSLYVMGPYVVGIISAFCALWSVGQLTLGGEPIREYVYESASGKLRIRLWLTMIFSGLSFLGEGLYLILNGAGGHGVQALVYLILCAAALGASLLGLRVFRSLSWEKIQPESP